MISSLCSFFLTWCRQPPSEDAGDAEFELQLYWLLPADGVVIVEAGSVTTGAATPLPLNNVFRDSIGP